ncbi:MAG: DNA sulfur modification protein DndE [Verrucomicrobiales bacterium]|nr:DNA sulfur modification protein DndE [Verrucomicrobiales bacterium]
MKPPIESIRLSQKAKDQLSQIKRITGIENWNILCRWALCLSLAEESDPAPADIPADSSVEMSWKTFAGDHADIYSLVVLARCGSKSASTLFRLHLHRGIGYLQNNLSTRQKAKSDIPLAEFIESHLSS